MKRIRIAVDARPYFMRTGIARYTRAMLHELTQAAHHDWLLLISDHHTPDEVPLRGAHVDVQVSSARWLGGRSERKQLEAEAAAWRADVFYSVFPPVACGGIRTVTTVFDLIPCSHPELLPPRVVRAVRTALARAIPLAERIVAISEATAAAVRAAFPHRAADVGVGACGVSGELAAASPIAPRRGVLFVGTIEPRKNVPLIVEAARRLPQVPFTLVGKPGWGGYDLAPEIAPLANVTWRGQVSDIELGELYSRAALFVYPSAVEGFGLPVLEAIHAGVLPLVSSDPALREVVPDSALIVPAGDARAVAAAIEYWLANAGRREQVLAGLQEHARRFTWAEGARAVLGAIESAATGSTAYRSRRV